MIHFTLFGIPIYIRPGFWVIMAWFGGLLTVREFADILPVAIFMIAGFVAILGHEMGHALVGRKLGGGDHLVELIMFGGLTHSQGTNLNKWGSFWTLLAGPVVTFIIGLLAWGILWRVCGPILQSNQIGPLSLLIFPSYALQISPNLMFFVDLVWIGLWWTVLNLLPIYPLDGGQIMALFIRSPKKVFYISGIVAVIIAAVTYIYLGSIIMPAFMAFFAFSNFREAKNAPF